MLEALPVVPGGGTRRGAQALNGDADMVFGIFMVYVVRVDVPVLGITPRLLSLLSHEKSQAPSLGASAVCRADKVLPIGEVLAAGDAYVEDDMRALAEPRADGVS